MVLNMQNDNGLYNFPDADSKVEAIRQFSERLSEPSELFALHIAGTPVRLSFLSQKETFSEFFDRKRELSKLLVVFTFSKNV
jgi:hypothetical protein